MRLNAVKRNEWIMEVVSELNLPTLAEPVEAHSPFDKLKANGFQALSGTDQ